jgi:hypothetical protein
VALTDVHIDGDLEVVLESSPAHDHDAIVSAPPTRDARVSG